MATTQHRRLPSGRPVASMQIPWEILEYDGPDWPARLERDWLRLYAAMPSRSVYHSLHAHRLYARHLMPADHELRYFGPHDGDQVRAICPLEASVDHGLGVPLKVWATPLHRHWPFSDAICPEDAAREALIPALADYLARSGERRPLLLGPTPAGSRLWNGLRELSPHSFCAYQAGVFDVFDCTMPFAELLGRRAGKFRQDVRRGHKKLAALPDVRYTAAVSEPELSREFQSFLDIEAGGWKAESGNVIKFQPGVAAFYRGLLSLSDAGDHATLLGISSEGRTIASQFDVQTGSQLTFVKTAYNEAYSRVGPGLELLRSSLEYCCADPKIARFVLTSSPQWVQRWQPDKVSMGRAYVHLEGMGSRAYVAAASVRYGPARPMLHRVRELRDQMRSRRSSSPPAA